MGDLGPSSLVLLWLVLPFPCSSSRTFLFLAQLQTLNLSFTPRQSFECEGSNSGLGSQRLDSMCCQHPRGAFLSGLADLEKTCPQMSEMAVGNVPTVYMGMSFYQVPW